MLKLTDPTLLRSQLYIDGKWVDADSGATMPILNPATREEIVSIPNAGADEIMFIQMGSVPHKAIVETIHNIGKHVIPRYR